MQSFAKRAAARVLIAAATLSASDSLAQSLPSSSPVTESSAMPDATISSSSPPPLAQTAEVPSSSPPADASSSPAPQDHHVDPASIGASAVAVPPAPPAERVTATAPAPSYVRERPPQHEEDNGRSIDFLFIQAEAGLSVVDLTGLSQNGHLIPTLSETRQSGYGGGATVGFRSWIFAVAAHGYISRFVSGAPATFMGVSNSQSFDLGELMLEGQVRLPIPVVEPYVRIGLGYSWLGSFELNSMYTSSTSDIHGFIGKLGAGADVWLGKFITIGAGADFALMNLRRGGVQREGSICPDTDPTCIELRMDGDAVGCLLTAHVQAGIHF
jgi:hypothetical protein